MKLVNVNNLIAKAKIEAQGMSEPFKTNFTILVEWLVDKTPETIIRCRDCEYGEQDEFGYWWCRDFGCQVSNIDGSGFCSDGERRTDETNIEKASN